MRVNSISFKDSINKQNANHNSIKHNQLQTPSPYLTSDIISFQGDDDDYQEYNFWLGLPNVITTKVEKAYARYTLEEKDNNWEEAASYDYYNHQLNNMGFFKFCFTKAPEREELQFLNRIRKYRSEILNEQIKQKEEETKRLEKEQKNTQIIIGGKMDLHKKFLNKVAKDCPNIPTAILIHSGDKKNREQLIKWLEQQTLKNPKYHVVEFDNEDTYKTIYRLETEIQYAESRYDKSKQQTIIFINNFDDSLKKDNGALKNLLFENSDLKKPVTLVFQTQNPKELASAFIGNAKRIPVKIKLDESIIPEDFLLTDRYTPYYDGYKYKIDKSHEVELYLGSFGTDKSTLWINSSSRGIIKKVLDNIRIIKQEEKFKNVSKVQCYGLDENEDNFGMYPIDAYTKNYDRIFQKDL